MFAKGVITSFNYVCSLPCSGCFGDEWLNDIVTTETYRHLFNFQTITPLQRICNVLQISVLPVTEKKISQE